MSKRVLTGCRDCKSCTNSSAAHAGRGAGRFMAKVVSGGTSEAALATRKKCRVCGHQMSLHEAQRPAPPEAPPAPKPTLADLKAQWQATRGKSARQPTDSSEARGGGQTTQSVPPTEATPSVPQVSGPPAGWYTDQHDASMVRWYDGTKWSEFTKPRDNAE